MSLGELPYDTVGVIGEFLVAPCLYEDGARALRCASTTFWEAIGRGRCGCRSLASVVDLSPFTEPDKEQTVVPMLSAKTCHKPFVFIEAKTLKKANKMCVHCYCMRHELAANLPNITHHLAAVINDMISLSTAGKKLVLDFPLNQLSTEVFGDALYWCKMHIRGRFPVKFRNREFGHKGAYQVAYVDSYWKE